MRKRYCAVVLVAALLLTACASGPDLSSVHRNMEAEYIAGLLLKYDENNDEMLDYDRSILNPTPTPEPTKAPVSPSPSETDAAGSGSQNGGDNSQVTTYISMKEMGTIQGVTLSQETYMLKDSYGSDYAVVSAGSGKRLMIVKFRLKNGSSKAKKVNMADANLSCSLEIDGQNMGTAQMSLLSNDLLTYHATIGAGESREAVLIFEVNKSQKVKNAVVYISDGKQTAQISLK